MILLVIFSFFLCLGDVILVASTNNTNDSIKTGMLFDGRNIGGQIRIENNPGMASIEISNFHNCAGSIISKSVVLTSAQCTKFPLNYLSVRVGSAVANTGGSKHKVIVIRRHEGFEKASGKGEDDVALLKVSPPFKLGKDVGPIPLVSKNHHLFYAYSILKVYGWTAVGSDRTLTLREALLVNSDCKPDPTDTHLHTIHQFCVIPLDKNVTEVCQGNLGSPVVMRDRQIGIVPYQNMCISRQSPKVLTRLSYYRDWIDENVAIMENIKDTSVLSTYFMQNVHYKMLPYWFW